MLLAPTCRHQLSNATKHHDHSKHDGKDYRGPNLYDTAHNVTVDSRIAGYNGAKTGEREKNSSLNRNVAPIAGWWSQGSWRTSLFFIPMVRPKTLVAWENLSAIFCISSRVLTTSAQSSAKNRQWSVRAIVFVLALKVCWFPKLKFHFVTEKYRELQESKLVLFYYRQGFIGIALLDQTKDNILR